ncbi:MBL fold metallo-hydrolase [Paracraurococcus lichenis]|uniref:MBL fold metallo-hydrolase n=1 Tax=Paracraurococcus lichenis TaxID=3064888 RepID=A0ABT9E7L6_9PROT|nr:MBL fold metallo-hydrolase [Paracraurococcus sp. LOR1-02]MDO9712183.1 MBL fold metallo-hydrolase [Paracraurococcus sp. LOR1-02]
MPLTPWSCANCGHWQRYFAAPPDCPVCTDTRNDLPEDGWRFLPPAEVRASIREGRWRRLDRDMVAFSIVPGYGLNGTGWLLLHPEGNIAFEAAPFYTDAMLAEIDRLGGIRFLAASHVHGYGALWQLQDVFKPEVLAIQKEDLRLTKAFRVTWPYDEALELRPGLTLYHVGGHYEGQAVLHDANRRILFCGDAFKVDQDAEGNSLAVSTHKAFHKSIPLTPAEIRRYRAVIEPLDFDTVCTPFERAPGVTRDIALAVLDDQLRGPPGVRHIPIDELRRRATR